MVQSQRSKPVHNRQRTGRRPTGGACFSHRAALRAKEHAARALAHAAPRDLDGTTRAAGARGTVKTACKKLAPVQRNVYLEHSAAAAFGAPRSPRADLFPT